MSEEQSKVLEDVPAALKTPGAECECKPAEEKCACGKEAIKDGLRSLATAGEGKFPAWMGWLCALSLLLMLNQVRLPGLGGKLALGDIGFVISFVPVFLYCLIRRRRIFYPLCAVLSMLSICVANIAAASGMGGAVDIAQFVQQIFCGVLLMSVLVEQFPGLAAASVFFSVVLNLVAGLCQLPEYGFGSVMAPADILKLRFGIGGAYTGLFRSRMAFSFFLAVAIVWLQPVIFGRKGCKCRLVAGFLAMLACLLAIPHGQMFLIASFILILGGFLVSRGAGISSFLAVAAALVISLTCLPAAHHETVASTLNPMKVGDYPGELRTNHIDFAAALKMAAVKPFSGVGSGRYQQCVGRCYGDLPNPSYNDIDTDTQAGWGILAGTAGFVTAACFLLLLASAAAAGIRRALADGGTPFALGGGLALVVFILGMFLSDPLTRGLGWMLALALASAIVPNPNEKISAFWRISPFTVIALGVVFGGLICVSAMRKTAEDPLMVENLNATHERPAVQADAAGEAAPSTDFFKIIDAAEVKNLTAPVEKGTDKLAAKGAVLKIPDGKGNPKGGQEPGMEFGGAVFEFEMGAAAECSVWLRVWWDGSCGNTINVRMDDEPKSITVGNDGTYRTWHWMKAPKEYKLEAGKHTVTLLNREDGIMFDQMLITNDQQYVPQDIEEE